jgi:cytochrome b561
MTDGYSRLAMAMHWIGAALVVSAWVAGSMIDETPRGPERLAQAGLHAGLGLIVLAFTLARLGVRLGGGAPPLPAAMPGWERALAKVAHLLLYALMIGLPLGGIGMLMTRGQPLEVPVLGAFTNPFPDPALREAFAAMHGVAARVLLALVVLHVVAVIWHVARMDGVAARMIPGLPARKET